MSYYGDYYAGDPGLFGSIGKFIGKVGGGLVGGVIKTAFPAVGGVLTAANAIRGALSPSRAAVTNKATSSVASAPSMVTPVAAAGGVPRPAGMSPYGLPVRKAARPTKTLARRAARTGARRLKSGRYQSAFLQRKAAQRRRRG